MRDGDMSKGLFWTLTASLSLTGACHSTATPSRDLATPPRSQPGSTTDRAITTQQVDATNKCQRAWTKVSPIPEAPFVDRDAEATWTGARLLVWDRHGTHAASYAPKQRRWTSLDERFPPMRVRGVSGRQLLVAADGQFPKPLAGALVDGHSGETRPFAAPTKVLLEPLSIGDAMLFSTSGMAPIVSDALIVFEPAAGRWTEITGPQAGGRHSQQTEIVGASVLVRWGGREGEGLGAQLVNTGVVIDLRSKTRRALAGADAPAARARAMGAASASRIAVWGGEDLAGPRRDGGVYDLAADRWQPIPALEDDGDDWRGLALTDAHLLTWDHGPRIAVFDLARPSWTVVTLPETAWALGSTALQDDAGRLIFVGQDRYGIFDPARRSWCERPLPKATGARAELRALWTGDALLLWGGFDIGASGGCENHRGPEGCDPYVEHLPRGDGWLLSR